MKELSLQELKDIEFDMLKKANKKESQPLVDFLFTIKLL